MSTPDLSTEIVDASVRERAVARFRDANIVLPTFAQLADPSTIPAEIRAALQGIDPDAPHPLNLFRVHWYNAEDRRGLVSVPVHLELRTRAGVRLRVVTPAGASAAITVRRAPR